MNNYNLNLKEIRVKNRVKYRYKLKVCNSLLKIFKINQKKKEIMENMN